MNSLFQLSSSKWHSSEVAFLIQTQLGACAHEKR